MRSCEINPFKVCREIISPYLKNRHCIGCEFTELSPYGEMNQEYTGRDETGLNIFFLRVGVRVKLNIILAVGTSLRQVDAAERGSEFQIPGSAGYGITSHQT